MLERDTKDDVGVTESLLRDNALDASFTNLDMDSLPASELDDFAPLYSPSDHDMELASLGRVGSKMSDLFGRVLSPRENVFNKAIEKRKQLEAERAEQLEELPAATQVEEPDMPAERQKARLPSPPINTITIV